MSIELTELHESIDDFISSQDVRKTSVSNVRKIYWFRIYQDYLEYLSENKEKIISEYVSYLEDSIDSEVDRDNKRLASKDQRSSLPDSCVVCGDSMDEIHHIVPHSLGGVTSEENLVPLCSLCHDAIDHAEYFVEIFVYAQAQKYEVG